MEEVAILELSKTMTQCRLSPGSYSTTSAISRPATSNGRPSLWPASSTHTPGPSIESRTITQPSCQNSSQPTFLSLPFEIRLTICELASSFRFGRDLVRDNNGRLLYRLAWPSSPLDYRNSEQQQVDTLSTLNRLIRSELLPRIMRGYIVKFPAWTPEFKLQCMYWIEAVSEKFCRNIDWFWLEGLYWRFSVHLTGDGKGNERTECQEMEWEDARAQHSDAHRHAYSETFERKGKFVLRVDCAKHIRSRACASARRFARTVERLLQEANADDEAIDGRLGRDQVMLMLTWAALTGAEQMRELEDDVEGVEGGISIIHDPGRFWAK